MKFLLDTNVASQFGKRSPNRNVLDWAAQQSERDLALSAITLRELWYGVEKARMSRQADAEALAAQVMAVWDVYEDRILPIDARVARVWATLLAQSNKHIDDTGLAATATVHGLVVVTATSRICADAVCRCSTRSGRRLLSSRGRSDRALRR